VSESVDGEVVDDPAHHRLVLRAKGVEAELVYRRDGDRLVLVHTGVPEELAHHGVGARLVEAALRRAAAEGLTVAPWCPFARRWLREHPEAAPGAIDWTLPPAA
jgi:uncharacterized protein